MRARRFAYADSKGLGIFESSRNSSRFALMSGSRVLAPAAPLTIFAILLTPP